MNAIAYYNVSDMMTMAVAIAKSGLFGMKTQDQALALMLVAQAEGQHPATITQDYDIIQGKACRKTHSVMARFQIMGGKVEWHKLDEVIADATFSHPSGGSLRMTWTIDQAKKAGLVGKDNWKNYPRAMLRARVIAEGVRAVFPAAIGGMMVAEEAQDVPLAERDMGTADVALESKKPTLETYAEERFDELLKAWTEAVQSGKTTPERVISMVSSKAALSDEQKKKIRAITTEKAPVDVPDWVEDYADAEHKGVS